MTKFLSILNQIKIFHWQTKSYAEHQALGSLYETLDGLVDEFVEVFSGSRGQVPKAQDLFKATAKNYESNEACMAYLDEARDFLTNEVKSFLTEDDSELYNIRDEMLAAVNKTKYLLSLR